MEGSERMKWLANLSETVDLVPVLEYAYLGQWSLCYEQWAKEVRVRVCISIWVCLSWLGVDPWNAVETMMPFV